MTNEEKLQAIRPWIDPEERVTVNFLDEQGIPYEQHDRCLRLTRDDARDFPAFQFSAGAIPVDVTVLPLALLRQAPLERGGDKPMPRARLAALDALIEAESGRPDQRLANGT